MFIDEAYSLTEQEHNDYGKEAIDVLVKMMEDHREELIVIVAGYGKEMDDFIESNPGLNSRFSKKLHFENYSPSELWEILMKMISKNSYVLSNQEQVRLIMMEEFKNQIYYQGNRFGNARYVRNLFEAATQRQAFRVMTQMGGLSKSALAQLIIEDFI